MRLTDIRIKGAYKFSKLGFDGIYGYIRAFKGDEVAVSVMDKLTETPDFSGCGVFWLKTEDFARLVEPA